jgi:predicted ferric reductase
MKLWLIFAAAALAGAVAGVVFLQEPARALLPDAGTHGAWYASRAAGITSYFCLWLGLVGGMLMSVAWFDGIIGRAKLLAIHQAATLAGIALGLAHALILIPDQWTQFSLFDVLVPFGSYYERLDSGIGQLSLYLGAIVSFSFWFRARIGIRAWRLLHYTSFAAYTGALWHGLQIGTDSQERWMLSFYLATSLFVLFSLTIRLTFTRTVKRRVTGSVPIG